MRLITVRAPEGQGKKVVEVALDIGVSHVSVHQAKEYFIDRKEVLQDVIEVATDTPKAKKFIEGLMQSSFYDPVSYTFAIRHPESLFGSQPPEVETHPVVRPTTDVYEELWQFSKVTVSLVGRVFLSSVLLAYGMVQDMLPLIIAGLLFLPYHHNMLAVGLSACIREWRLLKQGLLALLVTTVMILLAGVCVGLVTKPPIGFEEFGTPVSGFILASAIGIAAGLGAVDDAGRRELIGLAATAHISIYPAWFGLKLIFGFDEGDKLTEHLLTFCINVTSLTVAASITFAFMRMKGDGIRRFISSVSSKG